ncbi:MAG: NAD(P)-dependent oxidoreductase [Ferruginibacter sp.]|nr:NAD(P)-dependent oxidoreductase [Ferruginibacter sp.]
MKPAIILITGITGFIGSHVAEHLIKSKYRVIGLRRKKSDLWRCKNFEHKVEWVIINDRLKATIIELKPDIIIHCAWEGITANHRNDIHIQRSNKMLLNDLLNIAAVCKTEKFIALGSQAEYGFLNKAVSEKEKVKPDTAYGKIKVECCNRVERFCGTHNLNWYWLRLFAFYGPRESTDWFIPHIIKSLIDKKEKIELGAGTQKYAYLYIGDLVKYILLLVKKSNTKNGVYNISGSNAYLLKNMALKIKANFKTTATKLEFGVLPARANQSLMLKGKMNKFHQQIGKPPLTTIDKGLKQTIKYYKSQA